MKRTIKFVFFILLLSTASYSQTAFGLKGGLNFTTLNVSDAQATYNSRTGYHAGLFVREKFGKAAIQPELLLFTQQNTIDNYQGFYSVTQSFTYLSFPLLFKFYPIGGLNLHLGPQFGLLLDGERKTNYGALGTTNEDIKNYYKKSDISLSTGFGYDFNFGLGIDVRYNIGLQDINNVSNGEKAKSQIFLISIGWNFLGK